MKGEPNGSETSWKVPTNDYRPLRLPHTSYDMHMVYYTAVFGLSNFSVRLPFVQHTTRQRKSMRIATMYLLSARPPQLRLWRLLRHCYSTRWLSIRRYCLRCRWTSAVWWKCVEVGICNKSTTSNQVARSPGVHRMMDGHGGSAPTLYIEDVYLIDTNGEKRVKVLLRVHFRDVDAYRASCIRFADIASKVDEEITYEPYVCSRVGTRSFQAVRRVDDEDYQGCVGCLTLVWEQAVCF